MSKAEIELNLSGVNALMKSPAIQAQLQAAGEAVAAQASTMAGGAAFAASTHLANWIAVTNVYPDDADAAHRNFEDNTLLKAVGSVGLPLTKDEARSL